MTPKRTITVRGAPGASCEETHRKPVSVGRAPWEAPDPEKTQIPPDDWRQPHSWPAMGIQFKRKMWERTNGN